MEKLLDFDLSGSEKECTHATLDFMPSNWELDIEGQFFVEIYLLDDLYSFIYDKINAGFTGKACIGLELDNLYIIPKTILFSYGVNYLIRRFVITPMQHFTIITEF